jgi:predicted DNA binding CopG/RHH family protein
MTLTEIIEQLESCNYECEAGRLENNVAWQELKKMAQRPTWQEAAEEVMKKHAAAWARLAKE